MVEPPPTQDTEEPPATQDPTDGESSGWVFPSDIPTDGNGNGNGGGGNG